MDDHRQAGLGDHAPDRVEEWIVRGEVAHLHMYLEDPRAGVDRGSGVPRRARFGVEGRGVQATRLTRGEGAGPRVEPGGHFGFVRVDHGREGADSERVEPVDADLFAGAVGDRPLAPEQWADRIEVGPHFGQHIVRHEVGVDVDDAGQTQRFPESPDRRRVGGGERCWRCAALGAHARSLVRRGSVCSEHRVDGLGDRAEDDPDGLGRTVVGVGRVQQVLGC